jgi:hypothetical protein
MATPIDPARKYDERTVRPERSEAESKDMRGNNLRAGSIAPVHASLRSMATPSFPRGVFNSHRDVQALLSMQRNSSFQWARTRIVPDIAWATTEPYHV